MKTSRVILLFVLALGSAGVSAEPWERHVAWSLRDTGVPDCPQDYLAYAEGSQCLVQGLGGGTGWGNRACLMRFAINKVRGHSNDCLVAFSMALTAQCHNSVAVRDLENAGAMAVCLYLRRQ